MIIIRCLLITLLAMTLPSCKSSKGPRSEAKIYEGDTAPGIRMREEGPGTPVGD